MKRYEVERCADFAGGMVGATQTMFDEFPREPATAAGRVRTADLRRGQGAPHGVNGVIVQLAKFFRCPAPVADVRLVPSLPKPGLNLGAAILFDAVFRPLEREFGPLPVILWRIGPAGVNRVVSRARRPPVLIRLRLG